MRNGSSQEKCYLNDARMCVSMKLRSANGSCQKNKPQLRAFIIDRQDGVGGVVAAIMREEFQQRSTQKVCRVS